MKRFVCEGKPDVGGLLSESKYTTLALRQKKSRRSGTEYFEYYLKINKLRLKTPLFSTKNFDHAIVFATGHEQAPSQFIVFCANKQKAFRGVSGGQ